MMKQNVLFKQEAAAQDDDAKSEVIKPDAIAIFKSLSHPE